MKTIGTVVGEWMGASGLNPTTLASKIGVSRQNIEHLLAGRSKNPHYLRALAHAMGYTADDLLALHTPPPFGVSISHSNNGKRMEIGGYPSAVPYVLWRRIGGVLLLENDQIEADNGPSLLKPAQSGARVKATTVPDDSLAGELAVGTIVLLDPDYEPTDGDIVLVRMLDDSQHLRIYRKLADGTFDVETTAPRLRTWNSAKHGLAVMATVIGEFRDRRRAA